MAGGMDLHFCGLCQTEFSNLGAKVALSAEIQGFYCATRLLTNIFRTLEMAIHKPPNHSPLSAGRVLGNDLPGGECLSQRREENRPESAPSRGFLDFFKAGYGLETRATTFEGVNTYYTTAAFLPPFLSQWSHLILAQLCAEVRPIAATHGHDLCKRAAKSMQSDDQKFKFRRIFTWGCLRRWRWACRIVQLILPRWPCETSTCPAANINFPLSRSNF